MYPEGLELLLRRRSVVAKMLQDPGPGALELENILRAGCRVPDHKKLEPWRFIVFEGDARSRFGERLAEVRSAEDPDATEADLIEDRDRFFRAPVVIAVISSLRPDTPVPDWEQQLSAGAVCQNLLIAATALGYGAQWITEWAAFSEGVSRVLGLGRGERVAGFVYIGTAREAPSERARPKLEDVVSRWHGG